MSSLYSLFSAHPTITTDTRECAEGAIFFALKGENFNGNAFAMKALEAGCAYAVVDDAEVAGLDERMILVDDVLTALQDLAQEHRRALNTPIVQVTGTNGKTTTKELIAAVLATKHKVLYTQGNLNNHIGVPKTLLCLTKEHTAAVIETGANHPGEIALLSRIVDADCGLITNVGRAHLEGFGSFEGVVRTKGELYEALRKKKEGFIFLDGDNPHLCGMAEELPAITYGTPEHNYNIEGEVTACTPFVELRWRERGKEWHTVQTQLIGAYNLTNILAAIAVGLRFGVEAEAACRAIAAYAPTNNRSELKKTERNTLIIDAYNANPTSMKAALENFSLIPHAHKMAIIGEMRELGAASAEEHRRVAEQASALNCEELWFVGQEFAKNEFVAHKSQCADANFRCFPDVEAVKQELLAHPISDRLILIKGSNGTRLFQLPELL